MVGLLKDFTTYLFFVRVSVLGYVLNKKEMVK